MWTSIVEMLVVPPLASCVGFPEMLGFLSLVWALRIISVPVVLLSM